jgi:hypothetical protein
MNDISFMPSPNLVLPLLFQVARRSDVDPNGHINNTIYLAWALETLPQEVLDTHHLKEVRGAAFCRKVVAVYPCWGFGAHRYRPMFVRGLLGICHMSATSPLPVPHPHSA